MYEYKTLKLIRGDNGCRKCRPSRQGSPLFSSQWKVEPSVNQSARVQDPQTLSEAIKIAESADLCAKDHRFSHRNDRYSNPSTNHHTSTSQPGPSSRGPTPMEIGNAEKRKSHTCEFSRKYNKSPAEHNVMSRQGLRFKCGKRGPSRIAQKTK
jgi:hypothetical protein